MSEEWKHPQCSPNARLYEVHNVFRDYGNEKLFERGNQSKIYKGFSKEKIRSDTNFIFHPASIISMKLAYVFSKEELPLKIKIKIVLHIIQFNILLYFVLTLLPSFLMI